MPIYEFRCIECENVFEEILMASDEGNGICCPNCKSPSFERIVSKTNFAIGSGPGNNQPRITTKSCGSSNQCMTLDLPGHKK